MDLDSPATAKCVKRIPSTGDLLLVWNNAVSYAYRDNGADDRPVKEQGLFLAPRNPLSCAISRDEGQSWTNVKNIEDHEGYDSAYPSATVLEDEVFVTYYTNLKSGHEFIVSEVKLKIFSVDWFYSV